MKRMFCLLTIVTALASLNAAYAQNNKDTIKTPVPKDPMVIDPGKTSDGINTNPVKPNNAIVLMSDTGFINKNIEDNMLEIALAQKGLKKGNAHVKKAASAIIKDHTRLLKQLKKIAAKTNAKITVRTMPSIPGLKTGRFNAAWASEMLNMHVAKIVELEDYAATAQDATIKTFAENALPILRRHKQMLQKIPGAKITRLPNTAVQ